MWNLVHQHHDLFDKVLVIEANFLEKLVLGGHNFPIDAKLRIIDVVRNGYVVGRVDSFHGLFCSCNPHCLLRLCNGILDLGLIALRRRRVLLFVHFSLSRGALFNFFTVGA